MSASRKASPSCAILVRGMNDEAPFLNEFVAHYIALGFDRIYYINTKGCDSYVRECVDPRFLCYITVINLSNATPDWQESVLNEALRSISEDWFFNIDLDEFLHLGSRTIKQYINALPAGTGKIRFPWLISLSTQFTQDSVRDIWRDRMFPSKLYKTMARTEFAGTCRIHDIAMTRDVHIHNPCRYEDEAFMFHFACRGFYDLMNRIVGRNYQNEKAGACEEARLRQFLEDPRTSVAEYPFRFNLYRMQLSFPRHEVDFPPFEFRGIGNTDTQLLRATFLDKMERIGIPLPLNLGSELDLYLGKRYRVRERIVRCLPDRKYAYGHLEGGMSYTNLTRAYVMSHAQGIKNA